MGDVRTLFEKEMKELDRAKSNGAAIAGQIVELLEKAKATEVEIGVAITLLDQFYRDNFPGAFDIGSRLAEIVIETARAKSDPAAP